MSSQPLQVYFDIRYRGTTAYNIGRILESTSSSLPSKRKILVKFIFRTSVTLIEFVFCFFHSTFWDRVGFVAVDAWIVSFSIGIFFSFFFDTDVQTNHTRNRKEMNEWLNQWYVHQTILPHDFV